MKRYQFSLLYSINGESFSKWIRLKENSDSQGDALGPDGDSRRGGRNRASEAPWASSGIDN